MGFGRIARRTQPYEDAGEATMIEQSERTSIIGLRGKTLWDWLELLIVPVALGAGAIWFDSEANLRAENMQRQREVVQRDIEDQRAKDAVLSTYFDDLSNLLLERGLLESQRGSAVRDIARAKTLSALSQMDGNRKGFIVRFLYEVDLIKGSSPVLYLGGAITGKPAVDEIVPSRGDLNGAVLHRLFMGELNLTRVHMVGADFRWAILNKANFIGTDLRNADFTGARLKEARLSGADLTGALLHDANLSGAAGLKQDQLDTACGNEATKLPEGLSIGSC